MKLFNSFFIWLVLLCSTINFSQASVSVNKLDIFAPLKAIKQTDFPEEQITSKQKHQLLTIKIIKDPKFLLTDDFIFDSIT